MARFWHSFSQPLKAVVDSQLFNLVITIVILFSILLVGLSVEPSVSDSWKQTIYSVELVVLAFFSIEILLRIGAEADNLPAFFRDSWNLFDLAIVLLCFLPLSNKFLFLLRLARVLRTLRIFRAFPKLRAIINGTLNSVRSVLWVVLLLLALIYVYAVVGVSLFSAADPASFGSIPATFFTLFQVLTLESWNVIMVPAVQAYPIGGPVYFVSFIVIGAMLVMNLFLGVIIANMSKAMKDADEIQERTNEEKILEKVTQLEKQLESLRQQLGK